MTLLITGAGPNSFLGKHVLNEFKKNNFTDYLAPSSQELDLTNPSWVRDYFSRNKPTAILHLAARCGGIKANADNPFFFIQDNLKMTINLFDAIYKFSVPRFIALGSTCSYPINAQIPVREETMWDGRSYEGNLPYAESKKAMITIFQSYKKQFGLRGFIGVPANLYGTHDHFSLNNSHVIPALIRKFVHAVENETNIYCWGTGTATREFLNVEDCAKVLVKGFLENVDYAGPINLGTGEDISIKDLAELIGRLVDFKGQIIFTGEVSDGQPVRRLDVSLAKRILNWEAEINLVEGLKRTISWYKDNKHVIEKE